MSSAAVVIGALRVNFLTSMIFQCACKQYSSYDSKCENFAGLKKTGQIMIRKQ